MKSAMRPISLLHTAEVHIDTFAQLFRELDDSIPVRHVVEVELLQQAQRAGKPTPAVLESAANRMISMARDGASVVVCTCSTIGESVDLAQSRTDDATIIRVDAPMARLAVESGRRIAVVVCVAASAEPTSRLLEQVALERGREISIEVHLLTEAWSLFQSGELDAYHAEVARGLEKAAQMADVVVIGQASMAPAADLCGETGVPLLTSPRLGVETAVAAWRGKVSFPAI